MAVENGLHDKVLISSPTANIVGIFPESISYSVEQEYTNVLQNLIPEELQAAAQAVLDTSLYRDNQFFYVWTGGQPMMINWEMELIPTSSIQKELVSPLKALMKLATPKRGAGDFLIPPTSESGEIMVQFGNILLVRDVLILNVTPVPQRPFLVGGVPQRTTVSITIRTKKAFTQDDVDASVFPGM